MINLLVFGFMKVKELVDFLQSLDQDKNIFLVYDRFEFQPPDVDVLSEKDLSYFRLPDYMRDCPKDELPSVGDYFFDAY